MWAFHGGHDYEGTIMRTELYEQYKEQHPEEQTGVNTVFAFSGHVEAEREQLRRSKVERVQEWKRIFEDGKV